MFDSYNIPYPARKFLTDDDNKDDKGDLKVMMTLAILLLNVANELLVGVNIARVRQMEALQSRR